MEEEAGPPVPATVRDWHDRDATQSVQLGLAQLVAFINDFGK